MKKYMGLLLISLLGTQSIIFSMAPVVAPDQNKQILKQDIKNLANEIGASDAVSPKTWQDLYQISQELKVVSPEALSTLKSDSKLQDAFVKTVPSVTHKVITQTKDVASYMLTTAPQAVFSALLYYQLANRFDPEMALNAVMVEATLSLVIDALIKFSPNKISIGTEALYQVGKYSVLIPQTRQAIQNELRFMSIQPLTLVKGFTSMYGIGALTRIATEVVKKESSFLDLKKIALPHRIDTQLQVSGSNALAVTELKATFNTNKAQWFAKGSDIIGVILRNVIMSGILFAVLSEIAFPGSFQDSTQAFLSGTILAATAMMSSLQATGEQFNTSPGTLVSLASGMATIGIMGLPILSGQMDSNAPAAAAVGAIVSATAAQITSEWIKSNGGASCALQSVWESTKKASGRTRWIPGKVMNTYDFVTGVFTQYKIR